MDAQERIRQQLEKAEVQRQEKEREINESRKKLQAIDDHNYDINELMRRASRGVRGGK